MKVAASRARSAHRILTPPQLSPPPPPSSSPRPPPRSPTRLTLGQTRERPGGVAPSRTRRKRVGRRPANCFWVGAMGKMAGQKTPSPPDLFLCLSPHTALPPALSTHLPTAPQLHCQASPNPNRATAFRVVAAATSTRSASVTARPAAAAILVVAATLLAFTVASRKGKAVRGSVYVRGAGGETVRRSSR